MRLRLRLMRVILLALLRNQNLPFSGVSSLNFTVMPWDCVLRFVGNDRYHAFMDLGRIDLLIRLGAWNTVIRDRLQPFVYTVDIRYKRRLPLLQNFVLHTRLVHSDKKFFLMEHVFQCGQRIMATALSRNGLTRQDKIISTDTILRNFVDAPYSPGSISLTGQIEDLLRSIRHS